MTAITAVIGWPIEHSKSPQILNAAFAARKIDATMIPLAVPPEGLASALVSLRARRALGASITIPHKLAALALCDELSPAARAIGAVNCLQLANDRWIGHNTDEAGFTDGLTSAGFELRGKRVVLLGAGGAARAVAYGLREARAIEVIARRADSVGWARVWPWTAGHLRDAFGRADLVVDCTSAGLGKDEETFVSALPFDALRPTTWLATLIYHRPTILLERAKAAGHSTVDGRAMLVHQAGRAFAIWTGRDAPLDVMARALDDCLRGT